MGVVPFGYMSDRKRVSNDDIKLIMDKAFEIVKPLASTEMLFQMKEMIDRKEATDFYFDEAINKFAYYEDGVRRETPAKRAVESGVAICKSDSGELYFPELRLVGGLAMAVDTTCNGNPKDFVGSIHTHPGGLTTPSTADVNVAAKTGERIACIGTRYNDWDDGEKVYKRYKVVCTMQSTPPTDEEIGEYTKKTQDLLGKYDLFKLSKVGTMDKLGLNMRGDVLMPTGTSFEPGPNNTVVLVQKGTIPFLTEHDARSFDESTKDMLLTNYDSVIEEERRYDKDGKFEVTRREGY